MKKVLITGAKGNIGKILVEELKKDYNLTLIDLPKDDLRDYKKVLKIVTGHDAIIHLAWNSKTENFQSETIDPENSLMFYNIYKAALKKRIPRVIMASSIHADNFRNFKGKLLTSAKTTVPTSPYGVNKIFMENLGRYYSKKGLEVVCVRFGATGFGKPKDKEGKIVWFKDKDCISLVKTILDAKTIPNNFFVMYGVSKNKNRIHSFINPLGWKPKDDSIKF